MMIIDPILKRFISKVDIRKSNECWLWIASKNSRGYGNFWDGSRIVSAHRFVYEYYYKCKIPKGRMILHHCDNRACCNPKHLYNGTQQDNMNDRSSRSGYRIPPEKISLGCATFSAEKILAIRRLKGKGIYQKIIAKKFDISRSMIAYIWNRDKYPCREGYFV